MACEAQVAVVAAVVRFLVAEEVDGEVADQVGADGLGVVDVAGGGGCGGDAEGEEDEFEGHVWFDGDIVSDTG